MTVVIKIGGARAVDPESAIADVASLVTGDPDQQAAPEGGAGPYDVVVTHGGSTAVDDTLERLGIGPEYVETPSGVVGRFTDEETMDVFEMVMPGLLNTEMVASLQSEGVDAVGLSGVDGKLLHGPRKSAVRVVEDGKKKIRRGDHSGSLKEVNGDLLESLLSDGYTPVVSPPMAGADDGDVTPVNTDADRSAAAIAGELDGTLVLLTDVPGILEDPDDRETLIREVETPEDWERLEAAAEGFMSRKVMAIKEALEAGANEVVVADANLERPIATALEGDGTHVYPSALAEGGDEQ
ncbi:acetylglutamate/acetylaminoadipate kinase [Salinibaculum rarum]|uniref:acetylglutamate/acetylaminoadipate kinase n=1 Tax=Salinibaculum rarum TaxID=3058903 RepID=UPI00265DBE3B|nr:acetylglutamate/acetylaminoadipate kinase [Salinibaculum sp. KK48]